MRILFAPERPRDVEIVLGGAGAADRSGLVDQDGLRRGGRDVDPEDVTRGGQRSAPVRTGATRSAAQIC